MMGLVRVGGAPGPAGPAGESLPAEFQNAVYVSKNGNDGTADGSLNKPYLTIQAAMASISDASPSNRYAIHVAPGNYTETGAFNIKSNVFVVGSERQQVRIGASSFGLGADFTGSADNRSGFVNCSLLNAANFDWAAVTSAAGKIYCSGVSFNSTCSLNGHNNGIAQAQFWSCTHFGNFTVSGINLLTMNARIYASAFMNQHPILATTWDANGGSSGAMTITTTVNNFNRRCSMFAKSFWMDGLTVDGPSSYCDATVSSLPTSGGTTANGGQIIPLNPSATGANTALSNLAFPTSVNQPIMPATTNATNFGDWGKQWFWNFGYVHASTGTDLFVVSYPSAFGADPGPDGKSIALVADGAGLATNVNGGNISLSTASVSGTGVRGRVEVNARELSMGSTKITNLSAGTASTDAVNVGQLTSAFADRYRADSVALGSGVDTATVTFASPMPTADYTITYSLVNTVDANPKFLDKIVTSKSTTGFTLKFHQNTDSANYLLEYICIIHN